MTCAATSAGFAVGGELAEDGAGHAGGGHGAAHDAFVAGGFGGFERIVRQAERGGGVGGEDGGGVIHGEDGVERACGGVVGDGAGGAGDVGEVHGEREVPPVFEAARDVDALDDLDAEAVGGAEEGAGAVGVGREEEQQALGGWAQIWHACGALAW